MLAALAEAEEDGLHDDIEQPLVRVLARMEVVGIPVDRDELPAIAAALTEEVARRSRPPSRTWPASRSTSTPRPSCARCSTTSSGLTPGRKTKTGFSTDARTLEQLRDQHPIVEALLRYREVEKLRSTYGESLLAEVAADGRIHATFRQTVARTGRLSSDRPNLHNIPVRTEEGRQLPRGLRPGRRARASWWPTTTRWSCGPSPTCPRTPGLIAAFAAGEDIHRTVAAAVFGGRRATR